MYKRLQSAILSLFYVVALSSTLWAAEAPGSSQVIPSAKAAAIAQGANEKVAASGFAPSSLSIKAVVPGAGRPVASAPVRVDPNTQLNLLATTVLKKGVSKEWNRRASKSLGFGDGTSGVLFIQDAYEITPTEGTVFQKKWLALPVNGKDQDRMVVKSETPERSRYYVVSRTKGLLKVDEINKTTKEIKTLELTADVRKDFDVEVAWWRDIYENPPAPAAQPVSESEKLVASGPTPDPDDPNNPNN